MQAVKKRAATRQSMIHVGGAAAWAGLLPVPPAPPLPPSRVVSPGDGSSGSGSGSGGDKRASVARRFSLQSAPPAIQSQVRSALMH